MESLGATEGARLAGTADAIVDITTSGATLRANHLKILSDGLVLRSEAALVASRRERTEEELDALDRVASRLAAFAQADGGAPSG